MPGHRRRPSLPRPAAARGVHHISWLFVSICFFMTYALSHNIGASVFSGALVRYPRLYVEGTLRKR